jgi:hypothetical protein
MSLNSIFSGIKGARLIDRITTEHPSAKTQPKDYTK